VVFQAKDDRVKRRQFEIKVAALKPGVIESAAIKILQTFPDIQRRVAN